MKDRKLDENLGSERAEVGSVGGEEGAGGEERVGGCVWAAGEDLRRRAKELEDDRRNVRGGYGEGGEKEGSGSGDREEEGSFGMDFGNGQFEGMQFATAQRDGLKEASGSHCGVESQGLRVLVDDRERASGVIEALAGMSGISVQVQRLVLGDYLVGGNLIFERKTLRDFGVSLIDGRLFRQAVLLAKGKRRPVMILEGVETGGGSNPISQEALTGAMITLSLQFGISILRSHDAAETAKIIVMAAKQADRFASGVHPRPGYRPKGFYRRRLFILQGLPGLGPEKARKILAHFGTIAKIFAASEMELREVPGIGKKIAYGFKRIVQEESEQYPNQNSSPKEVNKIKSKPSQDPTIFSRCLPEKKLT